MTKIESLVVEDKKTGKRKFSYLALIALGLCLIASFPPGFHSYRVPPLSIFYASLFSVVICIVLSCMALRNICRSKDKIFGFYIAVITLILSGLYMLSMPYFYLSEQVHNQSSCRSNVFFLAQAIKSYASDHDGLFPESSLWCDSLLENVNNWGFSKEKFQCPEESQATNGYAFNASLKGLSTSDIDKSVVVLFEAKPGWNKSGGPELMNMKRHGGFLQPRAGHVLLMSGDLEPTIEFVTESEARRLNWEP